MDWGSPERPGQSHAVGYSASGSLKANPSGPSSCERFCKADGCLYFLLAGFSLTSAFRLGVSFSSMANAWISVVPTFSEECVMASVHDQALVLPAIVVFSPSGLVYFPLNSVSV